MRFITVPFVIRGTASLSRAAQTSIVPQVFVFASARIVQCDARLVRALKMPPRSIFRELSVGATHTIHVATPDAKSTAPLRKDFTRPDHVRFTDCVISGDAS